MLFLGSKSFCFNYYVGRGTVFVWLLGKWKPLGFEREVHVNCLRILRFFGTIEDAALEGFLYFLKYFVFIFF